MHRFAHLTLTGAGIIVLSGAISMTGLGGALAAGTSNAASVLVQNLPLDANGNVKTVDQSQKYDANGNLKTADQNLKVDSNGNLKTAVQSLPPVQIDASQNTVKLDSTANTVQSAQSGAWNVGISGTPNVKLDAAGNTVKLDPNANTVHLDSSSPLPVTVSTPSPSTTVLFDQADLTQAKPLMDGTGLIPSAIEANLIKGMKFSWHSTMPVSLTSGTGAGVSTPQIGAVTFVKSIDQDSGKLMNQFVDGTRLNPTYTIFLGHQTPDGFQVSEMLVLQTPLISGISQDISDTNQVDEFSDIPLEQIQLRFSGFQLNSYADGSNTVKSTASYNF